MLFSIPFVVLTVGFQYPYKSIHNVVEILQKPWIMPWKVNMWPTQIPPHDIVIQYHPCYQWQEKVGLVCREISQVKAVIVLSNLCT